MLLAARISRTVRRLRATAIAAAAWRGLSAAAARRLQGQLDDDDRAQSGARVAANTPDARERVGGGCSHAVRRPTLRDVGRRKHTADSRALERRCSGERLAVRRHRRCPSNDSTAPVAGVPGLQATTRQRSTWPNRKALPGEGLNHFASSRRLLVYEVDYDEISLARDRGARMRGWGFRQGRGHADAAPHPQTILRRAGGTIPQVRTNSMYTF